MSDTERYMRQLDYIDLDDARQLPITIIGAGGIGSWTALALSKSGFQNITIYDHDVLEEHNVSNQAYQLDQVDQPKVEAINEVLETFGEQALDARVKKFEDEDDASSVTIMAVDSIEARQEIFDAIKDDPSVLHIIDGRMGLTTLQVYTIDMMDQESIRYYDESLDAEDVAELPCTARATMSTAMVIGGIITSRVVGIINDKDMKRCEVYDTKTQHHITLED